MTTREHAIARETHGTMAASIAVSVWTTITAVTDVTRGEFKIPSFFKFP